MGALANRATRRRGCGADATALGVASPSLLHPILSSSSSSSLPKPFVPKETTKEGKLAVAFSYLFSHDATSKGLSWQPPHPCYCPKCHDGNDGGVRSEAAKTQTNGGHIGGEKRSLILRGVAGYPTPSSNSAFFESRFGAFIDTALFAATSLNPSWERSDLCFAEPLCCRSAETLELQSIGERTHLGYHCFVMALRAIEASLIFFMITAIRCVHCTFTPADNYLIDCGSLTNTTIGSRVFAADVSLSSTLTPSSNNLANTSLSSIPSAYGAALFQSARVFTEPSSYSFQINAHGRHFIRLYFFPFLHRSYDLSAATFSVSAQDVALLGDFQPKANATAVKEFSLDITSDTLSLTFAPTGSSPLAFVNAIEVVSVPDDLIGDTAKTVQPLGTYRGLSGQPLETMYRINMGGPRLLPNNDTLWRTWETDSKFLLASGLSQPVSYSGRIIRVPGGATQETAPDAVYASAEELSDAAQNTSNSLFNVTWQFDVDAKSSYLIRFHFCDIVSKAAGDLLFNVYINTWLAANDLDLATSTVRSLATAVFMDFVVEADVGSDKLSVGISPSTLNGDVQNAILNGLEIMKINGSAGSAVVVTPPGSKKHFGVVILGSILGAIVVAAIVVCCVLRRRRRRRKLAKKYSKTWAPFSTDGFTSYSAIVDARIAGSIKPESLRKYGETIEKCLADSGVDRPSMGDVLWNLEYLLHLQEADADASQVDSINGITELSPRLQNMDALESTPAGEAGTSPLNDLTEVSMSKVFSQLIKSEGR
ncbi:hypothetical protein OPV22_001937 [Ensete ventricosum]|uniref:Malectin-like domain-containing protein n=1 Tax=Ensete ventricosum TaxID=4639 RepID=A0AAV8RU78_ENSVE|nr:hypothetical protein OPV22_001937 [Ensete ventricosum]